MPAGACRIDNQIKHFGSGAGRYEPANGIDEKDKQGQLTFTNSNLDVPVTDALSLAASANGLDGGILDLTDNDLIVHGGNLTAVTGWLSAGAYAGGHKGVILIIDRQPAHTAACWLPGKHLMQP